MRTNDGIELLATRPAAIVRELRMKSYTPTATDAEFMTKTAMRAQDQTGKHVRYDTAANFVADLVAAGLLITDVAQRWPGDGEQRDA